MAESWQHRIMGIGNNHGWTLMDTDFTEGKTRISRINTQNRIMGAGNNHGRTLIEEEHLMGHNVNNSLIRTNIFCSPKHGSLIIVNVRVGKLF